MTEYEIKRLTRDSVRIHYPDFDQSVTYVSEGEDFESMSEDALDEIASRVSEKS